MKQHVTGKTVLLLFCILIQVTLFAQGGSKPVPCSQDPVYRQFDFWIGEWEVFSAKAKRETAG